AGRCPTGGAGRSSWAKQKAKQPRVAPPRQTATAETRTYSKRDPAGEEDVVQVSLERQRLKVRWGRAGRPLRGQTLRFNTPDEARAAYFARIDELNDQGYLDASAG